MPPSMLCWKILWINLLLEWFNYLKDSVIKPCSVGKDWTCNHPPLITCQNFPRGEWVQKERAPICLFSAECSWTMHSGLCLSSMKWTDEMATAGIYSWWDLKSTRSSSVHHPQSHGNKQARLAFIKIIKSKGSSYVLRKNSFWQLEMNLSVENSLSSQKFSFQILVPTV